MEIFKYSHSGNRTKLLKLLEGFGSFSYNAASVLLRKGDIRVNGKKVYENVAVNDGDKLEVYGIMQTKPIVIYEDMNILAVYKRKGIKTDGGDGFESEIRGIEEYANVILCHRLDTNTDGIVLFAKDADAEKEIVAAFKAHKVEKKYIALVNGVFAHSGIQKAYLSKNAEEGTAFVTGEYFKGSESIETRFELVESFKGEGLSLLDITPITGKTHQIRAHLKYLGYFIAGDGKYGDERINRRLRIAKQQLTAYKISFHFGETSLLEYLNDKSIELKNPRSFIRIPADLRMNF
ncbi:MAG: RluA family pseudouridine synthase [Clostridiales bacterium]|jgi:23S rRNA pseudouridine955/2504/2580 synthase|nr:RluA family pseudouridine synthase [Clostridiales bacterium]